MNRTYLLHTCNVHVVILYKLSRHYGAGKNFLMGWTFPISNFSTNKVSYKCYAFMWMNGATASVVCKVARLNVHQQITRRFSMLYKYTHSHSVHLASKMLHSNVQSMLDTIFSHIPPNAHIQYFRRYAVAVHEGYTRMGLCCIRFPQQKVCVARMTRLVET